MKHGDKAKSKTASKASGKKGNKASARSKSVKVAHAKKQVVAKSSKKSHPEKAAASGNGKGRPSPAGPIEFTSPVVAAAFKRAVKKYSNAFRRLTD